VVTTHHHDFSGRPGLLAYHFAPLSRHQRWPEDMFIHSMIIIFLQVGVTRPGKDQVCSGKAPLFQLEPAAAPTEFLMAPSVQANLESMNSTVISENALADNARSTFTIMDHELSQLTSDNL
jgi:hypothetical protein